MRFFSYILTVVVLLFGSGCGSDDNFQIGIPSTQVVSPSPTTVPSDGPQLFAPQQIPQYNRVKHFGGYWKTVRGSCDVREIVIERASGSAAKDLDQDGCADDAPFLDPYTGNFITRTQAEIEHVYPVKKTWDNGAWLWTQEQREAFYQDQTNLLAVTSTVNESKSDRGPDQWRPPSRSGWCLYSSTYYSTAVKYNLRISPLESTALQEMLATCPSG